jgi:hypothetical protein
MSRTKEADLIGAVLTYAARCLVEGDGHALRHLNFGTREVEALRELTMADIDRASALRGHFLEIRLDREAYWQIMAHVRREREAEQARLALIRADAPLEMLQALFGISGREHTAICGLLGVRPSVGRPPSPDEETARRVWAAYQERRRERANGVLEPADYVTLHRETEASMRLIWPLVQEWEAADAPSEPPAPPARRAVSQSEPGHGAPHGRPTTPER